MSLDFTLTTKSGRMVFEKNITHNMTDMAKVAGIYNVLWRPLENRFLTGADCVKTIKLGLERLENDQEYFEKFNSPNGWGTYAIFVPSVRDILEACKDFETALVHAYV